VPEEKLILICITRSLAEGRDVYNATRGVWKVNRDRVSDYRLVLGHDRGRVVGAFRPEKWLEASTSNFDWLNEDIQGRWGFEGGPAEARTQEIYIGKSVPNEYRAKGAASPIRYIQAGLK
jgi:hypothetical protein